MTTSADFSLPTGWVTVADLWQRLGQVPLDRIRLTPAPGTAVEQDVLDANAQSDRSYELIDGVLVE